MTAMTASELEGRIVSAFPIDEDPPNLDSFRGCFAVRDQIAERLVGIRWRDVPESRLFQHDEDSIGEKFYAGNT